MITIARTLDGLVPVEVLIPRAKWGRAGWSGAETLPTSPGPCRLRLRHDSGAYAPVEVLATWDGRRFTALAHDPYTAVPSFAAALVDALLANPSTEAAQWQVVAWTQDTGTAQQPAVP